jgi:glycosyltransferase involved in cell wall biosynthesis
MNSNLIGQGQRNSWAVRRSVGDGLPRLGLFLNMPVREVHGELTARYAHLFDFFMALAQRTSSTDLCVPASHDAVRRPEYGTIQLPENVRLVSLPHWSSAPNLVRRAHRVIPAALWTATVRSREWDVVGAVVPSLVGSFLIGVARLRRRPVFLLIRGEKQRTVSLIMGPGRRARAYVAVLRMMEALVRRWIDAGAPAFVAGDELVQRYQAPGARLFNLYPGLSRDFPVLEAPRAPGHRGERPLRLVCVARLSPEKGIDDLLAAVSAAVRGGASLELWLVGDGPDRARLQSLAESPELDGRVRFLGFVSHGEELVRILDQSDVFVLASRSEGLPHSVVEAMARGLPVIATEIGGLPELLGDGTGVLLPPAQPDAVARVLDALAAGRIDLPALSARSLERVRRFQPEAQVEDMCRHLADAYPSLVPMSGSEGRGQPA